jgi:hypothetical protein
MTSMRLHDPKQPATRQRKEVLLESKDTRHDAGLRRTATPIRAAAALLGIYVALHLAVAGIIHILSSPDAFAVIGAVHSATAAATGAARPKIEARVRP